MKVRDRYTDTIVELPQIVEPGRYQLTSAMRLNGRTVIEPGEILWDDGTHRCDLGEEGASRSFVVAAVRHGVSSDTLVDEAVSAVVEHGLAGALPSPIMPAKLGRHSGLSEIERRLDELLKAGHLQEISKRPRLDMRYDAEMLPLSRAKRLAPDALTRLAAHSEDWQRRTLVGIVPARVNALVSEDDYVVYENVVFVRLVDRLEALLLQRVYELETLRRKHEEALKLANAENLDRRLRHSLCTLWGQSFDETLNASAAATDALQTLDTLLGKVRQLRYGHLYPRVPRSRQLPPSLRSTNILRHDQHYRELPPMWDLAHSSCREPVQTPEEKHASARAAGERYAAYLELLVRRALAESLILQWSDSQRIASLGPWNVGLRSEAGECNVELRHAGEMISGLTFVAGWRGELAWESQREDRYVVFCHSSSEAASDERTTGEDSVLNPLQFYAVERIRLALEKWLLKEVLGRYPFGVSPVPGDLASRIAAAGVRQEGNGIEFPRLLDPLSLAQVRTAVQRSAANAETKRKIHAALQLNEVLGICRVCGSRLHPASLRASGQGFKATCVRCGSATTLKLSGRAPVDAECQLGGGVRDFAEVGCRELCVSWAAAPARGPAVVAADKG